MGGISWVGSVTGSQGGGTSMAVALPSGLAADDGVFALVMANSALTPPAGWTLQDSNACAGSSVTQTLYLYRKDTVAASDSGVGHTWSQASNVAMGVTYFAVRAESGVVVVHSAEFLNYDNGSYGTAEAIPTAVCERATMVCVTAATTILQAASATPTAPLGTSKFTATTSSNYRLAGAYAELTELDTIIGTWTMVADTASNGVNTLTVLLRDQEDETTLAETLGLAQSEALTATYGAAATDGVGLRTLFGTLFEDTLAETFSLAETLAGVIVQLGTLAEEVGLNAVMTPVRRPTATVAEGLGLALTQAISPGVVLREGLRLAASETGNQKLGLALAEVLGLAETLAQARPATLTETIGLAESLRAVQVAVIAHELGLAPALSAVATYALAVTEELGLASALLRFLGGDISEGLGLAPVAAGVSRALGVLEEGIGVAGTLTPSLVLRVTLSEGLGLEDVNPLSMVYAGVLEEGVAITGGLLFPDGSLTTWAMNTRTGAVSEYDNYEFNSFARLGHKYVGASAAGLYELLGDDDAGDDIVASLQGGFLQFGGTRLSRLKAAYIAALGDEDEFVLKIETRDGAEYVYRTATRDGRSTKFHMGKGQRSRYFAWTLTSVGQDFNLDTLEFVPIVLTRRV